MSLPGFVWPRSHPVLSSTSHSSIFEPCGCRILSRLLQVAPRNIHYKLVTESSTHQLLLPLLLMLSLTLRVHPQVQCSVQPSILLQNSCISFLNQPCLSLLPCGAQLVYRPAQHCAFLVRLTVAISSLSFYYKAQETLKTSLYL